MNDIYTNSLALDCFCADIIEGARDYYKNNPPKKGGENNIRDHVEFWVENHLTPAIECAIDDTFEEEEDDDAENL